MHPYSNRPPAFDPASSDPFAGTSPAYAMPPAAPPTAPGSLVALETSMQGTPTDGERAMGARGASLRGSPSTLAGMCILAVGALLGALFGVVVRTRQSSLDAELAHREQLQRVERAAAAQALAPAQPVAPPPLAVTAVPYGALGAPTPPAVSPPPVASPTVVAPAVATTPAVMASPAVHPSPKPAPRAYSPPPQVSRPRAVAPRERDREEDDEEEEVRPPKRSTRASRASRDDSDEASETRETRETKRTKKRSKRSADPDDVLRAAMGATRNTL